MTEPAESYLDHNASAPLLPEAREAILRTLDLGPGNASSSHAAGRRLRRVLGDARDAVAELVGARAAEVVFTSGTSEANALALRGLLRATPGSPKRLIVSAAEHDGTLALSRQLATEGIDVVCVGVDPGGVVACDAIRRAASEAPSVLALTAAQPVSGALQPVRELATDLRESRVHCDAAQLVGRVAVSFPDLGVATLAFSGHKIGGPHGIGALILRDREPFAAPGGEAAQERGRRPGTEAVALAAGFAAAAPIAAEWPRRCATQWRQMLEPLRAFVAADAGGEVLSPHHALPNTLLIRFAGCPGDVVLAALDAQGVRVSTGTACASGARTPPHVLTAAGRSAKEAAEGIRVSVGHNSTPSDVARLIEALRQIVPRTRQAQLST